MLYDVIVALGYLGYRALKRGKKKIPTFREKLGFQWIEKLPEGECFWFHAVSLGEMRALHAFAKEFEKRGVPLIFSSQTETGLEEARRSFPDAYHLYLPLDLRYTFKKIFKRLKPKAIFLMESDFWWNFLSEGKRAGAKIIVLNGKISEQSFRRFLRFKWLSRLLFKRIDLCCVQNEAYKERFLKLGVAEEKIAVAGNLKLSFPAKASFTRKELGFSEEDKLIVIGSTHDKEEEILLHALSSLLKENPRLKIAFAPRHPERFERVFEILKKSAFTVRRLSDNDTADYRLLLVDQMGVLNRFYAVADLAIVAGSFVSHVGGHHLLEPTLYKVPTLFGPYTKTQQELRALALKYQAGVEVTQENVAAMTALYLYNPHVREEAVRGATRLLEKECFSKESHLREISRFGNLLS